LPKAEKCIKVFLEPPRIIFKNCVFIFDWIVWVVFLIVNTH
jgi:hypothetical protein